MAITPPKRPKATIDSIEYGLCIQNEKKLSVTDTRVIIRQLISVQNIRWQLGG